MPSLSRFPLSHFLAVVKHGGIGKAATVLGVAQPAVTKSIQRLEERCGASLFERLPRGMRLTAVGEALVRHAQLIEMEYRNAEVEIAALIGGQRGTINVGAGPTWLRRYLPRAIARLHATQPNVVVRVHTGTHDLLIPALREGHLDLVLSALRPQDFLVDDEITHESLVQDALVLIAREEHPLARRNGFEPAELLDFPWIVPLSDIQNRDILKATFRRLGLPKPKPAVEAASVTITLSLLREADYLCFQAAHYLFSPEAAGLVKLDMSTFSWQRDAGVSYRNTGTMISATRLLLDELRLAVDHHISLSI
ncbi:LysR family transcriptional regulator [Mesorhizobium denitrificans]|uniref:LysR family transcriptional regulator n=1 Tax=Mesorhizobium denitrificans TaxID=2294114 RepID=A0A371X1V0_9HYPH|nr:LysR substrate-binding domain-containing protein [Mesorhizobium denitrificans]RFC63206.1 LysR family transcriptional regulator [Mesorhizobium denitrificans]